MPIGIGRRPVAKQRIAKRSIGAAYSVENLQAPFVWVTEGANTFTAPKSGYWKFHAWGPGGNAAGTASTGGGSGAYLEITKNLAAQKTVALVIGAPGSSDTTLTFPDATVATAGKGAAGGTGTGGTATGGDYMLNGSAADPTASAPGAAGLGTAGGAGGANNGSGAGAPGVTGFPGGRGGDAAVNFTSGLAPGGGAGSSIQAPGGRGGNGMIIAYLVRE